MPLSTNSRLSMLAGLRELPSIAAPFIFSVSSAGIIVPLGRVARRDFRPAQFLARVMRHRLSDDQGKFTYRSRVS